jgi:hypothetical protein
LLDLAWGNPSSVGTAGPGITIGIPTELPTMSDPAPNQSPRPAGHCVACANGYGCTGLEGGEKAAILRGEKGTELEVVDPKLNGPIGIKDEAPPPKPNEFADATFTNGLLCTLRDNRRRDAAATLIPGDDAGDCVGDDESEDLGEREIPVVDDPEFDNPVVIKPPPTDPKLNLWLPERLLDTAIDVGADEADDTFVIDAATIAESADVDKNGFVSTIPPLFCERDCCWTCPFETGTGDVGILGVVDVELIHVDVSSYVQGV